MQELNVAEVVEVSGGCQTSLAGFTWYVLTGGGSACGPGGSYK